MTPSDTTRAAVQRFYQAVNDHDVDAVVAAVTDDLLLRSTLPPDGDSYRGAAAIAAFFSKLFDSVAERTSEQTPPGRRKYLAAARRAYPPLRSGSDRRPTARPRRRGRGRAGGARGAVGSGASMVEALHRPETGKAKTMPSLHNVRSDKVATAPSRRGPFAKRRAVLSAAGYYEWLPTEDADGKPFRQPYYIHPAGGILSFAGRYELWPDPAKDADDPDRWLWSAAIITHHATWLARVMNDRTRSSCPRTGSTLGSPPELTDKDAVHKLIRGIEYESLQVRAVSTAVNKTGRGASRGPELIEPLADHDDSVRIIHAALDQGINVVDTADMYSDGESEEIVGKALLRRRDDVVLATKVHFLMGEGAPGRPAAAPGGWCSSFVAFPTTEAAPGGRTLAVVRIGRREPRPVAPARPRLLAARRPSAATGPASPAATTRRGRTAASPPARSGSG